MLAYVSLSRRNLSTGPNDRASRNAQCSRRSLRLTRRKQATGEGSASRLGACLHVRDQPPEPQNVEPSLTFVAALCATCLQASCVSRSARDGGWSPGGAARRCAAGVALATHRGASLILTPGEPYCSHILSARVSLWLFSLLVCPAIVHVNAAEQDTPRASSDTTPVPVRSMGGASSQRLPFHSSPNSRFVPLADSA